MKLSHFRWIHYEEVTRYKREADNNQFICHWTGLHRTACTLLICKLDKYSYDEGSEIITKHLWEWQEYMSVEISCWGKVTQLFFLLFAQLFIISEIRIVAQLKAVRSVVKVYKCHFHLNFIVPSALFGFQIFN